MPISRALKIISCECFKIKVSFSTHAVLKLEHTLSKCNIFQIGVMLTRKSFFLTADLQ